MRRLVTLVTQGALTLALLSAFIWTSWSIEHIAIVLGSAAVILFTALTWSFAGAIIEAVCARFKI